MGQPLSTSLLVQERHLQTATPALVGVICRSSTTAREWLGNRVARGLLLPAKAGQRIRTWRLAQPWTDWVLSQPNQQEQCNPSRPLFSATPQRANTVDPHCRGGRDMARLLAPVSSDAGTAEAVEQRPA